jgi:hypothetical protein
VPEQGIGIAGGLEAAEVLETAGVALASPIEPYLQYPLLHVRRQASRVLGALLGAAPAIDETIDPEAFVLHRDDEVRHHALRAIHDRSDRSLFRSLVIAEAIDEGLRRLTGDPSLPFSWWDWKEILPEAVIRDDPAARLVWAREQADAVLGPQRVLAAIEPIMDRSTDDVIAHYGTRRLPIDDTTRDVLAAADRDADA